MGNSREDKEVTSHSPLTPSPYIIHLITDLFIFLLDFDSLAGGKSTIAT